MTEAVKASHATLGRDLARYLMRTEPYRSLRWRDLRLVLGSAITEVQKRRDEYEDAELPPIESIEPTLKPMVTLLTAISRAPANTVRDSQRKNPRKYPWLVRDAVALIRSRPTGTWNASKLLRELKKTYGEKFLSEVGFRGTYWPDIVKEIWS